MSHLPESVVELKAMTTEDRPPESAAGGPLLRIALSDWFRCFLYHVKDLNRKRLEAPE